MYSSYSLQSYSVTEQPEIEADSRLMQYYNYYRLCVEITQYAQHFFTIDVQIETETRAQSMHAYNLLQTQNHYTAVYFSGSLYTPGKVALCYYIHVPFTSAI